MISMEVSPENMRKYVCPQYKTLLALMVTKIQLGLFLFWFHSLDDMMKILEGQMKFVFEKPFLLRK